MQLIELWYFFFSVVPRGRPAAGGPCSGSCERRLSITFLCSSCFSSITLWFLSLDVNRVPDFAWIHLLILFWTSAESAVPPGGLLSRNLQVFRGHAD